MGTEDIRREEDGARGRYVMGEGGAEAELTYTLSGSVMTIDHTGTPPPLRGQGIAARLTERAVADARAEGRTIVPACPYVAAWFAKHPDEGDVLAAPSDDEDASGLDIRREETDSKGRYSVRQDGEEAELTYSRAGDCTIIVDHTGVPEALRGRGLGEALARRVVEDARAEGRSIVPLCPFFAAQVRRHPDWRDVVQG